MSFEKIFFLWFCVHCNHYVFITIFSYSFNDWVLDWLHLDSSQVIHISRGWVYSWGNLRIIWIVSCWFLSYLGDGTLNLIVNQFRVVGFYLAFIAFRFVYNALATGWPAIFLSIESLNLLLKFFIFTFEDACVSFSREFREFKWTEIWVGEILFWKNLFFIHLRNINFTFLVMIASIYISGLCWELIRSNSSNFNLFSPSLSSPSKLSFQR